MKYTIQRLMLGLLMGSCLVFSGCEDDEGGSSGNNISGFYHATASPDSRSRNNGSLFVLDFNITQKGSQLSGDVSGSISGDDVTFTYPGPDGNYGYNFDYKEYHFVGRLEDPPAGSWFEHGRCYMTGSYTAEYGEYGDFTAYIPDPETRVGPFINTNDQ